MGGRADRGAQRSPAGDSAQVIGASRARRPSWKLAALGIALGLAVSAVVLKLAPRAPVPKINATPPGLAGSVLVEDEGPIRELLFQYVAAQEPLVLPTYTDFLRAIDAKTRLVAVIPAKSGDAGGADEAAALRAFLGRVDPSGALVARTRIVETEGPITVWSKDRALVLEAPRTQLVVPIRPDPKWRERFNDWATLGAVARAMPERFLVNEVPLEYDAGDFAVTGGKVIVDVNLLAKNEKHGLTTPKALSDFVASTFRREVVFLGEKDGDLPRHHLSMYMTPIGGGVVLVGDPRAGREVVGDAWAPGEESPDTAEPLVADFSDATLAKFDRAAKDLAAAGFQVERIPVVPFDDKTYLTYTNGVYETRDRRKIAYLPEYRFVAPDTADAKIDPVTAKLDAIAEATYRRLGWEVRPIRVRDAYRFHGTIGCLCNILSRAPAP